jgi:sugar (pentulose or hexulose) kinase
MERLDLAAFDFGASGGRCVLGRLAGGRLTTETVHSFPNGHVEIEGHLHWDFDRLLAELKLGLRAATDRAGGRLACVGIDTWGVDYGLLDDAGRLLEQPYHYRDARVEGVAQQAWQVVPAEEMYHVTGIAHLPFNTVYQLLAARARTPELLARAETMLLMPDMLGYFLTGRRATEYTNATTTGLVGAAARDWSRELIARLDLPERIFAPIDHPGGLRGTICDDVRRELDLPEVNVAAVASHDTASAVAAVPLRDADAAWLSAGTWSLLGAETAAPVISADARGWNFTNEGGTDGRYRLLRNIAGMWILQECRRAWADRGQDYDWAQLAAMTEACESCGSFVDPDAAEFAAPGDMPGKIARFCRASGQAGPTDVPRTVRCVLESLALKYRWAVQRLEKLLARRVSCLHVVGGGSRNDLLNRFTASAIGRPVVAGPAEATATGNLMMQARALGAVADADDIRRVVERSIPTRTYQPGDAERWERAYAAFASLLGE